MGWVLWVRGRLRNLQPLLQLKRYNVSRGVRGGGVQALGLVLWVKGRLRNLPLESVSVIPGGCGVHQPIKLLLVV